MSIPKKILDRIEKLLRMAADVGSPNEAAIAASRAAKLMEKYQIEESDVVLDEINSGAGLDDESIIFGKSIPKHLNYLLVGVVKFHDCIAIGERWTCGSKGVNIAGYKYDVQAALQTFNFLTKTIDRLVETDWNTYKAAGGTENARSWKTSYKKGAAVAILVTLKELKATSEKTEIGTSLVVAKSTAIAEHYGQVNYNETRANASSTSYRQGYEQGKKVKINKAIEAA